MSAESTSTAPTVLLVQPQGDTLDLYCEYLAQQRVHCLPVTTVLDALAAAPSADVVVTGILLPGSGDGVELIERLRADGRTKHLPIIVLTACVFEAERRRAEAAGCDAFLGKPCLPSDLYTEIRRLLTRSRLSRVRGRTAKRKSTRRATDAGKASGG